MFLDNGKFLLSPLILVSDDLSKVLKADGSIDLDGAIKKGN